MYSSVPTLCPLVGLCSATLCHNWYVTWQVRVKSAVLNLVSYIVMSLLVSQVFCGHVEGPGNSHNNVQQSKTGTWPSSEDQYITSREVGSFPAAVEPKRNPSFKKFSIVICDLPSVQSWPLLNLCWVLSKPATAGHILSFQVTAAICLLGVGIRTSI